MHTRVRTILVLGYWVLPNIFQDWVLVNIFIGCHTQYRYCSDTLIPVASRWQQGNWGERKVKLESWQMQELKMKYNSDISFYNKHGYFNSHSMGKLVLYTCTFVEKSIQCFTLYWYGYWVLGIGMGQHYWVLGALLGIVLTLMHTHTWTGKKHNASSHTMWGTWRRYKKWNCI